MSSGARWEPIDDDWAVGDIVWQNRMPGGECLVVGVWGTWEEYKGSRNILQLAEDPVSTWSKNDFPVLRVLHPTEGLIVDPSYYYQVLGQEGK